MQFCLYPWDPLSRIRKEYCDLQQDKLENCDVTIPDPNNGFLWKVKVKGPPDSPYEAGTYILRFDFPEDYPRSPPRVRFETSIFHPNINEYGDICLHILRSGWTPRITIAKVILAILSLMAFPMIEDAVNPQIARMMEKSREAFENTARRWTLTYAWIRDSRPEQSPPPSSPSSKKGQKSKESKKSKSSKKGKK